MSKSDDEISIPFGQFAPPESTKAQYKPNAARQELVVFLGEFVGTFQFLFLAFAGTQIASESASTNSFTVVGVSPPPEIGKLLYIALSFGVALAVNVAVFADISGGMFNPAVTTALWAVGLIRWQRALHSVLAQLLGAMTAAAVVGTLFPGPLPVATVLEPSMSLAQGLLLETFLTAQLILTILMLPASSAKPAYIGMTLFIAELGSVYFTGGSLNPARSFGPAVFIGFESSHWIYWVGPLLGAGMGSGVFALINLIKAEMP